MKIQCCKCHKLVEIPITESQLIDWYNSGEFIQNYFPELTPEQREMILSQICDDCWTKLFPEDEE